MHTISNIVELRVLHGFISTTWPDFFSQQNPRMKETFLYLPEVNFIWQPFWFYCLFRGFTFHNKHHVVSWRALFCLVFVQRRTNWTFYFWDSFHLKHGKHRRMVISVCLWFCGIEDQKKCSLFVCLFFSHRWIKFQFGLSNKHVLSPLLFSWHVLRYPAFATWFMLQFWLWEYHSMIKSLGSTVWPLGSHFQNFHHGFFT